MTIRAAVWGIPDAHFQGKVWIVYERRDTYRATWQVGWELDNETAPDANVYERCYGTFEAAVKAATAFAA
jgi:hypothetical protein